MNTKRCLPRLFALLLLLALLPVAAQAAPTGKTYNLTRMFGIRNVDQICYFGRAHVALVSTQPGEGDLTHITVTFISLADDSITGQASFEHYYYPGSVTIQDENVRLSLGIYDEDDNLAGWEEILVASDGSMTTRELPLPDPEGEEYPLPGGAVIVEQYSSLFLRTEEGGELRPLLTRIPYPEEDDSPDPLDFHFYAALDDHRFVYYRIGWDGFEEGCGEYDITTGESRRLDEWGWPCLLYEGQLYTTQSVVDLETYKAEPLPNEIRASMNIDGRKWTLPSDGRILCELVEPPSFDVPALRFYAMDTGEKLGALDLELQDWGYPIFIAPDTVGVIGLTADGTEEVLLLIARL